MQSSLKAFPASSDFTRVNHWSFKTAAAKPTSDQIRLRNIWISKAQQYTLAGSCLQLSVTEALAMSRDIFPQGLFRAHSDRGP